MSTQTADFGKIRSFLWPIHNYELKKLLPMLFMFFFISFNYSVVRNIKDALVIHATGSPGAEIIPYLKFWGVIPMAILFMIVFAKMSNILSKQNLFYCSVVPFIVFFIIFATVLYPNHEMLHLTQFTAPAWIPEGFLAIFRIWSFSFFYIFAELWGSVALSLLFWGFANDTTRVSESKRFYALFGIGANVALVFSGYATSHFANPDRVSTYADPMQATLNGLITLFVLAGFMVMALYWWINRYVLTDPRFYDPKDVKKKKEKPKMSLSESCKFLFSQKYLLYIAILVIAYGMSINLIEVSWKNQLKMLYNTKNSYLEFMGMYSRFIAWTTIFLMLFVTGNVVRRLGWGFAAQITPVVLLISGAGFFGLLLFDGVFEPMLAELGVTVLTAAVVVGTFQNVISKSSKYALFDPTKEMTYIPLDQESKVKGKAAIDVVGSRLGKAGGSLVQQGLFMIGPLTVVTPYIAAIVTGIILLWIYAVTKLSKEFKEKQEAME